MANTKSDTDSQSKQNQMEMVAYIKHGLVHV